MKNEEDCVGLSRFVIHIRFYLFMKTADVIVCYMEGQVSHSRSLCCTRLSLCNYVICLINTKNKLLPCIQLFTWLGSPMGQDIFFGTATRNDLGGSGFKLRRGRDFSHHSWPTLVPCQAYIQMFPLFQGLKRSESIVYHPRPSSTEVKK